MCIIVAKEKGKEFDKDKLDFSYESNKDGCGIMWFDGEVKTHTTLDYEEFKTFLESYNWFKDYPAVIHLRYTTVGETTLDLCHPFTTHLGSMMHNGTIHSLKDNAEALNISDSKALSFYLTTMEKEATVDMYDTAGFRFLLEQLLGYINRVVFLGKDGEIRIYNEEKGDWVDGLWYSNDYYKNKRYEVQSQSYRHYSWQGKTPFQAVRECSKVFVYGSLKEGKYNHNRLKGSEKVGKATTVDKWAMIGEDLPFPYCIEEYDKGYNVVGEVYEVTVPIMKKLDSLEGYPNFYDKKIIKVNLDGEEVEAWIYYEEMQHYTEGELIKEW